jgi:hypothetical protein
MTQFTKKNIFLPGPAATRRLFALLAGALLLATLASCGQPYRHLGAQPLDLVREMPRSFVQVEATNWRYSPQRPWHLQPGPARQTIGAILPGGLILITAQPVANHRTIELTRMDSDVQSQAQLVVVDYEANLALLKPLDPDFLADTQPLRLAPGAAPGDQLTVLQPRTKGEAIPSAHPVISVEVAEFPYRSQFLIYRLHGTLTHREGHFSLPVLNGPRLAGLLHKYDSDTQIMEVIAVPVIEHFLADAQTGEYQGFPTAGIRYAALKDSELRHHLGLGEGDGGVFIEAVRPRSPGQAAGVRKGDVLVKVEQYEIDTQGQYRDPQYGNLDMVHLLRCRFRAGETVNLEVVRQGQHVTLALLLEHTPADDYLVPPYVVDRAPRYFILGGLVFQELSAPYLEPYLKNGSRRPWHLFRYLHRQDYMADETRRKIVILAGVIPTTYTLGYEELSNMVVRQINGRNISRLEDLPLALESPINGFHKIDLEQRPHALYLDPADIEAIHRQIQQRYRIPALSNLN